MTDINNNENSVYQDDQKLYDKPTKAVPKPQENIGVDTDQSILINMANAGVSSKIDMSTISNFSTTAQSRERIYTLIDSMCEDSIVAAILETYAEDATEYSDDGRIVWVESSNPDIAQYVDFLLKTMDVDKNIYKWVYSLCKYGDVYLKLYRESDYTKDVIFDLYKDENQRTTLGDRQKLEEDLKVIAHHDSDQYSMYVEMVPNPANVFELTRLGKTYAYVKTDIQASKSIEDATNQSIYYKYSFRKDDVEISGPLDYVHASLDDCSNRSPEEVELFITDDDTKEEHDNTVKAATFSVKRGQSMLYSAFKAWREMTLLQNSILLSRLTKSSILRAINVEVGDMPKEMVQAHLQGIKQLIEQKAALNAGQSMTEYTNPGPVENTIYIPTYEGKGAITATEIGGDVNPGQLTDLDYFRQKFFGAMRIPAQYFGYTDDNAGFSGGQSLAIISSRYAKMVKRIQNAILQALSDAINLICLNKGLSSYINNFTLKMQVPTTQEEIDRRDNVASKVQITQDIVNLVSDISDENIKLKIMKALLSTSISNNEVITLLQDYIDSLENGEVEEPKIDGSESEGEDVNIDFDLDTGLGGEEPTNFEQEEQEPETEMPEPAEEVGDVLPNPSELGIGDLTNNNNENI